MTQGREVFQVEIRTRDLNRAIGFYRAVFDWHIYGVSADYALVDTGAMPIVGIVQTTDPRFPIGAVTNLLVDDCDREAQRAVALGARISVPKSEVKGSGWYIGTVDPWGNEVHLWQPAVEGRPNLKGSGENPVSFFEIASWDLPAAIKYYTELAGWTFWNVADGSALAEGAGLRRGVGIVGTPQGVGGTTSYIEVNDLAETARRVAQNGGTVIGEPADFPMEGKYFLFQDPDGIRMGAVQKTTN